MHPRRDANVHSLSLHLSISHTDEDTFRRVFGNCDWSVMFILSRTGHVYARLALSAGPGAEILLPVQVDWSAWPALLATPEGRLDAQYEAWRQEFAANVHTISVSAVLPASFPVLHPFANFDEWQSGLEWAELSEFPGIAIQEDQPHES